MKLLIFTQVVDQNDSNLGFFCDWLEKFSYRVKELTVICLRAGEYSFPSNVKVLSLGKEAGISRYKYVKFFYKYIFKLRNNYDGVLVHMNPEYVIMGGLFWALWRKPVALWYVHRSVTWKLRLAEKLVDKIFTASKESFRLKSKKVQIIGHGINIDEFIKPERPVVPANQINLLSVGRIAPTKDIETILKALAVVKQNNPTLKVSLEIIGEPILFADYEYSRALHEAVRSLNLIDNVVWRGGISHAQVVKEYLNHNIFIHTSNTGSLDKVVLEAMAAGLPVVSSSEAYGEAIKNNLVYHFSKNNFNELAAKIQNIYTSGLLSAIPLQNSMEYIKINHNLNKVIFNISNFYF